MRFDDFIRDLTSFAADVRAEPGVHAGGRRRADARHRRQHRDLLGRQRGAAQAGPVPGSRSARDVHEHRRRRAAAARRPRRRSSSTTAQQTDVVQDVAAFRTGVVNHTGGSVPGAAAVGAGHRRLLPPVRRAGRARPDVHARRKIGPNGAQGRRPQPRFWAAPLRQRSRTSSARPSRSAAIRTRSSASSGRLRLRGVRPVARGLGAVPARSEHEATRGTTSSAAGRLKPGVTLEQAQGAAASSRRTSYRQKFPNALGPNRRFSVAADARGARPQRALVAARAGRRGELRAADRLRQRRQPAAGARDRTAARDRHPRGDRRRARPHHPAAADRERRAVAGRRRAWAAARHRSASARCSRSTPPACRASARTARWSASTGASLAFTLAVSLGTGILFGLIPALQSSRTDLTIDAQGERRAVGHRVPAEQGALGPGRDRSRAGAHPARRLGAADPHRRRARRASIPGFDAHNVLTMRMSLTGPRFQKSEGVEQLVRDGVERLRAVPGVASASATCCVPLEGGYGLPFVIVGRPLRRAVPRRRRLDDGLARLLRGLQDPGASAGAPSPSATTATRRRVVIINEAMAQAVLAEGRSAERPADHRPRRHARVRATSRSARSSASSATSRDGGLNSDPGPTMYIPQAQVPDAGNALNVAPHADGLGRPHRRSSRMRSARRSRKQLRAGDRAAGLRRPHDGRGRLALDVAPAVQHVADDGVRRLGAAARGDRHLRPDGLLGRAADAGDRHPPRARRAGAARCKNMVVLQGMRLALVGVVDRHGAAFGLARLHGDVPVRRHRARSAGVRRRAASLLTVGRAARRLAAGAPREPGRSDHCLALRMSMGHSVGLTRFDPTPRRASHGIPASAPAGTNNRRCRDRLPSDAVRVDPGPRRIVDVLRYFVRSVPVAPRIVPERTQGGG